MIAEAEYSLTDMAFQHERLARGIVGPQPGDESLFVRFFLHPRKNDTKTAEEGRPIYDEVEYVEIIQPGNRDNVVCRPASDMDKARFARPYSAFLNKKDAPQSGTPLEKWPLLARSQVEELKFFNVHTVEQLADLADIHAQKFAGIAQLRIKARAYLEEASKTAQASLLADQLIKRDEEIAALKQQMEEMAKQMKEVSERTSVKGK